MEESRVRSLLRDSPSADPDDNGQIDRSVYIGVSYNPCGAGGNVSQ